ncbi:methylmalonate-semialdehyde dehydrogenase (acylating) [Sulfolobus sp. A20]|uniref:CoA-acylating methylmalonate-semialdehyde dehydrogenase n=1 Tax=Sulfolobaceae TaxID=118883 RepID=UPI000846110C|nr:MULTISPECIES: CoA-acylating methylmalonate-semialdehyde dehydrogenase [unclassified Sulfolobus]TRM75941.1 methylmalonate-semialdehyde dehydrogenase (CoA acylating) [Sulfolobus sp. A20-N-F8]TRM79058.1 methylmalonate-semialdehyde dehydrogenase (CoA acylating) [Sulfolobus sp. B5]TRM82251.1 methylmalonate-semialdehyde dehydrogenase (CoA acylating) [Sulfolobus sp. D5]TRM87777.1 methylmalonate-semialdehyde dehydrogenase (CoA acylating) [Sulfolobus sp. E3]TRM87981.1 methylmalonate-semialdehyde deh
MSIQDIRLRNYINGKFQESRGSQYKSVINPATLEKISEVPFSTREDTKEAIESAYEAFKTWSETPITERLKYLFRMREAILSHENEIARLITQEHGKTLSEAKGELRRALDNIEASIGGVYKIMGKNNLDIAKDIDEELINEPLGVFASIIPFNFPVMIPFWFLPYAIITGNTIIIKPSPRTPNSFTQVMKIIHEEVKIPAGVINLIHGDKEVVDTLLEDNRVKGITFVGTTQIAKYVYEKGASYGKRVIAQASAKNFVVIMPDADLSKAIPNTVEAFYGNAGQRCLAAANLVVFKENHERVLKAFINEAKNYTLGYGLDEGVNMGPMNSKDGKDRALNYIEKGISEGGKLVLDGRQFRIKGNYPETNFLAPSVFDDVQPSMTIAQEEIFGPVASVIETNNIDEAIEIINKSKYGNAASIFTSNGKHARQFKKYVKAGNIGVNIGIAQPIAWYPFAGMKDSHFGDLHGQGGDDYIHFFTDRKVIISRWW